MKLNKIDIPDDIIEFFRTNPFALMYSISNRGKGKTLFMSIIALCYSILFPKNKIDANYGLNLPNFHYNPYSFFPYNKLFNTLILIDDCKNVKPTSKIVDLTANDSRKRNLYLILSAQYKKFVAKSLREMAEYYVEVELDNMLIVNGKERLSKESRLLARLIDLNGKESFIFIPNPLELVQTGIYDTDEKVKLALDKYIIKEIIEVSDNFDDIIINLQSYYSKTEAIRIYKKLLKITFKELKNLDDIEIEAIIYNIPKEIIEKRKKEKF